MIGRVKEQEELTHWLYSGRAEFVVVYGRRRVGKTYLINEFFRHRFAFHATGVSNGGMKTQLRMFGHHLAEHGHKAISAPSDWFDAFARLRELLEMDAIAREPASGRAVVFIDEMPWMDTPRSNFRPALEHFWNSWASQRSDILLIACGSASSWLTKNLINDTEGFYGRVTGKINLRPFSLGECESLLAYNNVAYTRPQVIELYEVFGGVPYYMNLLRGELSPGHNVDRLCFAPGAQLEHEFDLLFRSLFKHPEGYQAVIRALAARKDGVSAAQLQKMPGVPGGATFERVVKDLELCGFIARATDFQERKRGARYMLVDFFSRFYLQCVEQRAFDSWSAHIGTSAYHSWRGNTFELVCMAHADCIKGALGITGVETRMCSWASRESGVGAQIDLVIDRRDGIVDLCEAKFTDAEYAIDKDYSANLARKRDAFRLETGTNKALRTVLVSVNGLKRNKYYHTVQAVVDGDALFAV